MAHGRAARARRKSARAKARLQKQAETERKDADDKAVRHEFNFQRDLERLQTHAVVAEGARVAMRPDREALLAGVRALVAEDTETMKATGKTGLPLSDRMTTWDASAAKKSLSTGQYADAHFWRDPEGDPETLAAYKLVFAKNDGGLTAIWRGVTACAGVIQGARGGVDIPQADVPGVKSKIESYYADARKKYDDDSIVPPWDASASAEHAMEIFRSYGYTFSADFKDEAWDAAATAATFLAYAELGGAPGEVTEEALDAFSAAYDAHLVALLGGEPSPERLALYRARQEFQHGTRCTCGHSLSEHAGAGGTCGHTDGRGTCTCNKYEETAAASVADHETHGVPPVLASISQAFGIPAASLQNVSVTVKGEDSPTFMWNSPTSFSTTGEEMASEDEFAPADAYTGVCANCEHDADMHAGALNDGPCTMDGCDCMAFEEGPVTESHSLDHPPAVTAADAAAYGAVVDINEVVAKLPPLEQASMRLRLEGLTLISAEMLRTLTAAPGDPTAPAVEALPDTSDAVTPPSATLPGDPLAWTAIFCPEAELTDDGRAFAPGSIGWRDLPLSLMAQLETEDGHDGAHVAGRIDRIWRDGNLIRAAGMFDTGEFGCEVARLVSDGVLRGVSVDIAIAKYEVGPRSQWFDEDGNWSPQPAAAQEPADEEGDLIDLLFGEAEDTIFVVTEGTIGASTVCAFPAFARANIQIGASLIAGAVPGVWTVTSQAGFVVTAAPGSEPALVAAGLTAAEPVVLRDAPPAAWFEDPEFEELTPLTVDDDGRVYGHAWAWDSCHTGYRDVCMTAPHSKHDNRFFHLGEIVTAEGESVAVGKITIDAPHADGRADRAMATAHYDQTGTVAAYVVAGEDEHGGWVAGCLRPDLPEETVRLLRGSVLSGDWRYYEGGLELIALLAVNVPGFPVPRTRALVSSGEGDPEVLTLLAAGLPVPPAGLLTDEQQARFEELRHRASRIEVPEPSAPPQA